jgi:hypothetical protein
MYTFMCIYFLHLFLVVIQLCIIIFTCQGARDAIRDGLPLNWPVACEGRDGKCVNSMAAMEPESCGGNSRSWGKICVYFYYFCINIVFMICIFYQIHYLY